MNATSVSKVCTPRFCIPNFALLTELSMCLEKLEHENCSKISNVFNLWITGKRCAIRADCDDG